MPYQCPFQCHADGWWLMLVCVCGGVGAGLDRVQRLQGHNAGLLRRGGPQVLPLPVPQHLPGGSPCPPVEPHVIVGWKAHPSMDATYRQPRYPATPTHILLFIYTSSIFIQSKMNCIISWYAELEYVYVRTLLLQIGRLSDSGRICTTTKTIMWYHIWTEKLLVGHWKLLTWTSGISLECIILISSNPISLSKLRMTEASDFRVHFDVIKKKLNFTWKRRSTFIVCCNFVFSVLPGLLWILERFNR